MKRPILAAALAAFFAGAAQAAVTEFILYQQPDFKGPSQVVKGEVNILENGFANTAQSLVVRGGYWEACTGDRFKGTCRVYDPGEYRQLGDLSRKIVSVRFLGTDYEVAKREAARVTPKAPVATQPVPPVAGNGNRRGALELYGREGFGGRSIRVEENVPDLYDRRFDGRASSLRVEEGTWQLCTEPRFEGRCRTFGPGEYPHLAGLDNQVSSIRQVR
jgi:hypothetical protein